MKTPRESCDTYSRAVRSAKERVVRLPADQLRNLFDDESVQASVSDLPVEVAIIRERHDSSGGILVVMQAFRPWVRWLPRGGNMFVDGFILLADGRVTEPEERDLWDYT